MTADNRIFIAFGSNLPSPVVGPPADVVTAALAALPGEGVAIVTVSPLYRTAPVPAADQPWFVNGVAMVDFAGAPGELLTKLHKVEAAFGRVREKRWDARILDLDLLAFADTVIGWRDGRPDETDGLVVPHPRLHERLFVLRPLTDIAPDWCHPVLGRTAAALLDALPAGQRIEAMETSG